MRSSKSYKNSFVLQLKTGAAARSFCVFKNCYEWRSVGVRRTCSSIIALLLMMVSVDVLAQDYDTVRTEESVITTIESPNETEEEFKFDEITDANKSLLEPRKVNEAKLKKLKAEDDFWYVNEAPKRAKPKEVAPPNPRTSKSFFETTWFRNLMWFFIVGGFVVILVWFLISSNVKLFEKKKTKISDNKDELAAENIFEIEYEAEIEKAIASKNYTQAIRLLYLRLLNELAQKNIINYKQERTNSDYVLQLFGTNYYKEFFSLTRSFEYSWYGKFPVSEDAFKIIQSSFSSFNQRISQ